MRRKDDEKQQRIKEAVMQLILQEGFAGTSISKIAKAAGVSPATVYIYYENKEEMLKDIYTEYSQDVYIYLSSCTGPGMESRKLIATLMRSYYSYIRDHEEIYSFIEQFSHCPALSCKCSAKRDLCQLFSMIDQMKAGGQIRNYSNESLASILFSPVKAVAMNNRITEEARQKQLQEVIELIQYALVL